MSEMKKKEKTAFPFTKVLCMSCTVFDREHSNRTSALDELNIQVENLYVFNTVYPLGFFEDMDL